MPLHGLRSECNRLLALYQGASAELNLLCGLSEAAEPGVRRRVTRTQKAAGLHLKVPVLPPRWPAKPLLPVLLCLIRHETKLRTLREVEFCGPSALILRARSLPEVSILVPKRYFGALHAAVTRYTEQVPLHATDESTEEI